MEKERQDRKPATLVLGLVGGSVVLALAILLRPAGHQSAAGRRTHAWPDKDAPRLQDPSMIAQRPEDSSVDMVERPVEAAKGQEVQPEPESPSAGGRAASAHPASGTEGEAAGAPPSAQLSAAEKANAAGLTGLDLTDPRKAAEIGASNSGLWTGVMKALSHHPRIMGYILNNDHVVKAFMSDPKNQQYCRSPAAAKSYLMDTKSASGVSHAMQVFDVVAHGDKAMPGVIFGSKLAEAMLDCPSGKSLVKDRAAIGEVAQANPGLLHMMLDPGIMMGFAANPRVTASVGAVQTSLTP